MSHGPDPRRVDIGEVVFDADGNEIGTIRGVSEDGVFVTTRTGVAAMSVEHERAGHEFGEAELLWRCVECGALGAIDEMPTDCPECGASKEYLSYLIED